MSKPAFLVEIHIWDERSLELGRLKLVPGRGGHQWHWNNSYVRREENTSKHTTLEVAYGIVVSSIKATIAARRVQMPIHCL